MILLSKVTLLHEKPDFLYSMHKDFHSPHTHSYILTYDKKEYILLTVKNKKHFHAHANSNAVEKNQ